MKEFIVGSNESNQRLDKLIFKVLNQAPKSFGYKMLRKKNITLNGKKATGNEKLQQGDVVRFYLADDTFEKFSKNDFQVQKKKLDIVYEDENVIFVNKPAGMLSQKALDSDTSLNEYVISYLINENFLTQQDLHTFKPAVVNRLDRNTSGLVVAGKTLTGLQTLSEMFRNRTLEKHYLCMVKGKVTEPITLRGFLKKEEKTNQVTILSDLKNLKDSKGFQPIETRYQPIETNGKITLLDVELITGKTHQIRAHLASVDHPIIGDAKYGDKKMNQMYQSKYNVKSQLLHCYCVHIPSGSCNLYTLNGKNIIAPLPKQIKNVIKGENLSISAIRHYLEDHYGNME